VTPPTGTTATINNSSALTGVRPPSATRLQSRPLIKVKKNLANREQGSDGERRRAEVSAAAAEWRRRTAAEEEEEGSGGETGSGLATQQAAVIWNILPSVA
jgi:hypothetical protein